MKPGGEFSFPPPCPIRSSAGAFKLLASICPSGTRRGATARLMRGFFAGLLWWASSFEGGLCEMQSSKDCGWYVGSWKVSSSLCVVLAPGWIVIMVVSSEGTYMLRRLDSFLTMSAIGWSSFGDIGCSLCAFIGAMLALPCVMPPIGTLFVGLFPRSIPLRPAPTLLPT